MDMQTRRYAQRRFRLFWVLNAIPVAFLLEDVLVLYGIRNGLPEPALAALASFVQLTMPFMLLGRLFTARWGLSGGWARAYVIRYSFASLLIMAPWFADVRARTVVILAGALVFAMFRAVGIINMHPLNGEITTEEDRGHYLHTNFALFNGAYFLAVIATILLTRTWDSTWIYQAMVALGMGTGLLSLLVLRGVPESGEGREAARQPFLKLLGEVRREIRLGVLIPAWAGGMMSFALVVPFAILFIKNGYGIDDHTALVFTLLTLIGSVTSGVINQRIARWVDPDRLVLLYAAVLAGVALFWAFAPGEFIFPLVALFFFLAGISRAGMIVGLQHHLISTNRAEHRMHVSLLVELTGSAVSGLTGTVVGGLLLQYFGGRYTGVLIYQSYFRVVFLILL
ncbi:MAG: MFS transporter, partial [Spirochaetaceae bacterium]